MTAGAMDGPQDQHLTQRRIHLAILCIAALWSAGLYVRLWDLGGQIVEDDEIHAVHAASRFDAAYLMSHHHASDYCIPLALWNQLLLKTVGLDEWGLRVPGLLAGAILGLVGPLVVWRHAGPAAAIATSGLMALSPLLVLYCRFARPYELVALFSAVAFCGWMEWVRHGRFVHALAFALSSVVALFFNIFAAPALAALAALAVIHALWTDFHPPSTDTRPFPRCLSLAGAATLGGLLFVLLLGPGWSSLWALAPRKSTAEAPSIETWRMGLGILLGTRRPRVLPLILAALVIGMVALWRRRKWWVIGLLASMFVQMVALVLLGPKSVGSPVVLARYSIAVLPPLLMTTAIGLTCLARGMASPISLGTLRTVVFAGFISAALCGLAWAGPLPKVFVAPNNFTSHRFTLDRSEWIVESRYISPFYEWLARQESACIVEAPWSIEWGMNFYGAYQRRHGHALRMLSNDSLLTVSGLGFKTILPLNPERLTAARPDYVILHHDLGGELIHVTGGKGHYAAWQSARRVDYIAEARIISAVLRSHRRLTQVYHDRWITVWTPLDSHRPPPQMNPQAESAAH